MCRVKCIYYNCILNNKELKNKEKYINLPLLTSLLFHLLSYHTFNNFNFLFGNCYVICDKKRETLDQWNTARIDKTNTQDRSRSYYCSFEQNILKYNIHNLYLLNLPLQQLLRRRLICCLLLFFSSWNHLFP